MRFLSQTVLHGVASVANREKLLVVAGSRRTDPNRMNRLCQIFDPFICSVSCVSNVARKCDRNPEQMSNFDKL